jgi:hypothetical protein
LAYPINILMTALLAVVGVGTGVQLGRSAISEINPLYYSEPETGGSYARLSGYATPGETAAPIEQPEYALTALGTGCIGCRSQTVEYYSEAEPRMDGYAASAPVPREQPMLQHTVYEAGAYAEAAEAVAPYASYSISEDEDPGPVEEAVFVEPGQSE